MEINRNKQVKKKEFTELNHSIFCSYVLLSELTSHLTRNGTEMR